MEERSSASITREAEVEKDEAKARATVSVERVTGKWNKDEKENTITEVSLAVRRGELVAIIGPTGSGKVSAEV